MRAESSPSAPHASPPRGSQEEAPASAVVTLERLLLRITMMDLKHTAALLRQHGLTLPQFFALLAVERGGEAGATMTDLAEGTLQAPSSLTGIVGRLVARGLCTRGRDDHDRRVVRVRLTPEGQGLLTRLREARRKALAEALGGEASGGLVPPLRTLLEGLALLAYPNGAYPPRLLI